MLPYSRATVYPQTQPGETGSPSDKYRETGGGMHLHSNVVAFKSRSRKLWQRAKLFFLTASNKKNKSEKGCKGIWKDARPEREEGKPN